MSDLINRNKLLVDIFEAYEQEFPTATGAFDEFATRIVPNVIKQQPTVDATPVVHAHWIPIYTAAANKERGFTDMYECSHCGAVVYLVPITRECDYNGCPYCFAKMDEVC